MRSPSTAQDLKFMHMAIELAAQHMRARDGGPFGAVVARGAAIVAQGWNKVTSTNDPTAHAEMSAIRAAAAALGSFQLRGCVLYTSCEPCPMCLGAAYWARLDRVVFAATRTDANSPCRKPCGNRPWRFSPSGAGCRTRRRIDGARE